jgi:hypothetical protein
VLNYFPNYFTSKAISIYLGVLVFCNLVFFSHPLSLIWWVFGLVEVLSFFYFSNQLTRTWGNYTERKFSKKLFQTALIIRLVWVVFSYFFYTFMTGKPFEFDFGDAMFYHSTAYELSVAGLSNLKAVMPGVGLSDSGYVVYLSSIYSIVGNVIIIPRLIKALLGAYTCVLIYKLSTRNFGEEVGRMSGIFCMLMPNLILYTGLHLKETEMLFLTVAFMERADAMFRNKKFNFAEIAPPVLLAGSLFFFRTVLGATAILSIFTTLLFTSTKIIGIGKRIVLIVWMLAVVGYFIGGTISTEVESVWAARGKNQENSMKWRSTQKNGNKFAKYAKGAVFAPIIFVIPFPTIIETPKQENQKLINGGNYVKNVMAFFTLFALFWIVKNKKWMDYLLIESFTIGYLIVIALSAFGQSERFHLPAVPFELVFAAFGISLVTNKDKKYFKWWLIFIFIAIVGWSWIKLAGRDLV